MKILAYNKLRLSSAILALEALLIVPIVCGSSFFFGCAHTVDYQALHDTATVLHHDTIPGPAFIRFLAILNNSKASPIAQLQTSNTQNADLFTEVNPQMRKQFIPVLHDSTLVLYANYFFGSGTQKLDSLTIPPLKSYSMTTVVLFRTTDVNDPNRIFPIFANDSVRMLEAPANFCYVRLINGLPDYPQPSPSVNMHIDDINSPAFFKDNITGQPSPVNYQEIRNYVLMAVGQHNIFVRSESDITQSYSLTQQFLQGQFYTIRLTGSKADSTDQISIDPE